MHRELAAVLLLHGPDTPALVGGRTADGLGSGVALLHILHPHRKQPRVHKVETTVELPPWLLSSTPDLPLQCIAVSVNPVFSGHTNLETL